MVCGVVVIGRNEGARLVRCLKSLGGMPCVYVDSGSTDDSVVQSRKLGVKVVELDLNKPFTAARARNEGFRYLDSMVEGLEFVMFVDGDCEITPNWFEDGLASIASEPDVAVVCGRRRERYPSSTVYNQMCDIEWNTPVGEAKACGGDAIYSAKAFRFVGGFDGSFIAGEEPELCFRLRRAGYKILRIGSEMTLHDAAMTRFGQWWKRSERSGHAYYLGYYAHGGCEDERFRRKEVRSILFWGSVPLFGVLLSLLLLSILPVITVLLCLVLQSIKVLRYMNTQGLRQGIAPVYASFTILGKAPQLLGVIKAWYKLKFGKDMHLVEYK